MDGALKKKKKWEIMNEKQSNLYFFLPVFLFEHKATALG